MNKSEVIKVLCEEHDLSVEEASSIVTRFFDAIRDALVLGGRVEIRGFGSFRVKEYEGYTGRNPKTGMAVSVLPKRLPVFRAGKELKIFLNQ